MRILFPRLPSCNSCDPGIVLVTNYGPALTALREAFQDVRCQTSVVAVAGESAADKDSTPFLGTSPDPLFFFTMNLYCLTPEFVRRNPKTVFVTWIVDDLRYDGSTFFTLLAEPNMMMFLTDRRMFQDLKSSHPSKVFHVPWASFFHQRVIEQPPKDNKRVVFIGNILKYVNLPSLDDLAIDETSRRFLKALAQDLLQDIGLDVRPAIGQALKQVDEATCRNHYLYNRVEYIVRREVNRVFRKQVVTTVAEAGIPLDVYGDTSWSKIFPVNGIYKGPLRGEEQLNRALSSGTIHLSLDAITMSDGIKMGTLDSAHKGVFTISNYTPLIDETFGACLPTFRRMHELPDMILYYLGRDDERRELATAARSIVKAKHTAGIRASQMKSILEEINRN